MRSITSLTTKLQADFPAFTFALSDQFRWSPDEKVISIDQTSDDSATLLHELAHAALGHSHFSKDIELIEMERDAWEYASKTLGPGYNVAIDEDVVQGALDSYRDWLHARSTCPECSATGIETKKNNYKCLACTSTWRVNDARVCALRRYKLS
ncbi:MAG: hypothetical protein ACHQTE_02490 [Candidatus Saccharimonadales bacterium]